MTSLIIVFGVALAVWGAVRKKRRHIEYGVITVVIGFAAAIILAMQSPTDSTVGVTTPRPPSRHGLSARRVENECLARVRPDLVAPDSMRFLGNPVGADPYWDEVEGEWRWIMDVSAVNAFNVRMRARYQCIVREGPTFTVQQVD